MLKNRLTIRLGRAFLWLPLVAMLCMATPAKADIVSGWSTTSQGIATDIVKFTSSDRVTAPNAEALSGLVLSGGIIDGQYEVYTIGGGVRAGARPGFMEFGLTSGYKTGQYDLGFNVWVDASDLNAFMNALTIQIVQYADDWVNSSVVDNHNYAATSFSGVDTGTWLNGIAESLFDGERTFIRFIVSNDYAGTYEIGVQGANTPEPATLAVLGLGLAGLGIARRRMKK